ncbi:MAG TPA: helix-turn-helix domain-containing protein [Solirubrobacterales bacterium]|nr:helix-turn-helix domain-containing protein [Solirubrobacterales bacterium]
MAHSNGNGHSSNGNGRSRGDIPVDWERLARSTAHPLRVSILEILGMDGGRVLSPSDLCQELQIPLSNTNYHVTELAKSGLIELVRQRQVRGATEHFYRLPAARASERGTRGRSKQGVDRTLVLAS